MQRLARFTLLKTLKEFKYGDRYGNQALKAWVTLSHSSAPAAAAHPRAFSSSSSSVSPEEDQLIKARFVRFFAAIFMLSAGIRVIPHAASSAVDHTVKLLEAKDRMLISAGLSRLQMLLSLDASQKRAIECGAVPRLLQLIQTSNDTDLKCRSMMALASLCQSPEGVAAMRENEMSKGTLRQFMAETPRAGSTEDALHAAKRILVSLGAE